MRYLSKLALLAPTTMLAIPTGAAGQDFPRDEVDEALDSLATERAQALNSAYYEYETALEEARVEAQRTATMRSHWRGRASTRRPSGRVRRRKEPANGTTTKRR